jgi:hypothetical protein
LPPQTFLSAPNDQQQKNYLGDINDAFACIAALGDQGCAFSSPLEAIRRALGPDNTIPPGGLPFLRPDALLAIVILTRQDDCSAPEDSTLMDPSQDAMSDPLGPLSTFRCNEFGHLCLQNGALRPPPRGVAQSLTGCVSNEAANSRLINVAEEVAFLKGLKTDPNLIFVTAITGPAAPYDVALQLRTNRLGVMENQPLMLPSCTQGQDKTAHPAVRIQQWVEAFGNHGLVQTICAPSFAPGLSSLATELTRLPPPSCVTRALRDVDPTTPGLDPDCVVVDQSSAGQRPMPACATNGGAPPCWRLEEDVIKCEGGLLFVATRATPPTPDLVTTVSCAIQ